MKKTLQEELNRYNYINSYGTKLFLEQELPLPEEDPTTTPPATPGAPADPTATPPADPAMPPMDASSPAPVDTTTPMDAPLDAGMGDTTEEIDITDLVNMTKSIKKDMENKQQETDGVVSKMDGVFTKLDDLEQKLAQMDNLVAQIENLGNKIEQSKPPTPVEKLEMRSLDSYPFSQNPQQFFNQKQGEMRNSGKNEYVLSKQDVQDYSKDEVRKSFNPYGEKNYEPRY